MEEMERSVSRAGANWLVRGIAGLRAMALPPSSSTTHTGPREGPLPPQSMRKYHSRTMMLRLFMSGTSEATAAARTITGRLEATAGRWARSATFF